MMKSYESWIYRLPTNHNTTVSPLRSKNWTLPILSKGFLFKKYLFINSFLKLLICVLLFATPCTVAYQASLSMGVFRQECWSGLPLPSRGDLPDSGIEPESPTLQADALPSEPPGKPPLDSTLLAPGTGLYVRWFPQPGELGWMVMGWYKHTAFTGHVISIILSAPPQGIKALDPEGWGHLLADLSRLL